MAQQYIFQMQGLTKTFPGGRKIFENIWLSFYNDAKIGVVGVNGSGKSTLLKIMAGLDTEFSGEARAADGIKRGYLEQEPQLDPALNVRENVEAWCEEKQWVNRFNAVAAELGENYTDELMEEMTSLQEKIDAADVWDIDSRIEMAMGALRCPPDDWEVTNLSGGEKRRVALARLLLSKPDMLLMDEPTNHLDAESVAWLQHHLENFPGCVILVTHDRYFLDQVTKWTLELDTRTRATIPPGWKPSRSASFRNSRNPKPASAPSPANWNGSVRAPRPVRPSPRPVWPPTNGWSRNRNRCAGPRPTPISRSRPARAWAMWCWRSRACRSPMATSCCSTI